MTDKHRDPVYVRNAAHVRRQVKRAWKMGEDVRCWRTGRPIMPGMPFDVGHIDPEGGHGLSNLAPESVRSNRSEGGKRGAAITNARRAVASPRPPRTTRTVRTASDDGLAPW